MRWSPGHRSGNVEDRRGGGGRFIGGAGGMGIGTLVVLLVLSLIFKRDFFSLVGGGGVETGSETAAGPAETTPAEEQPGLPRLLRAGRRAGRLAAAVPQMGATYRAGQAGPVPRRHPVRLRLRRSRRPAPSTARPTRRPTSTSASTTSCSRRFGAPGDFAQAYVLAHEIGHHVQNLLGTEAAGAPRRGRPGPTWRTSCRCGWSSRPTATPASGPTAPDQRDILEQGDVEEGLKRPRRWETTGCSRWVGAKSCPSPSPTGLRSSVSSGSSGASRPDAPTPATPSKADLREAWRRCTTRRAGAPPHLVHG